MRTRARGRASLGGGDLADVTTIMTPRRQKNIRTAPRTDPARRYTPAMDDDDDDGSDGAKTDTMPARALFADTDALVASSSDDDTGGPRAGHDSAADNSADQDSDGQDADDDAGVAVATGATDEEEFMDFGAHDAESASGSGDDDDEEALDLEALVGTATSAFIKRQSATAQPAGVGLVTRMDCGDITGSLLDTQGKRVRVVDQSTHAATDKSLELADAKRRRVEAKGPQSKGDRLQAKKKAQEKTNAGPKWFHMPKTEVTPEIARDFKIMKLRRYLDAKKHIGKSDFDTPEFFQMGRVVAGSAKDKVGALTRKERSRTIAEGLLKDHDARKQRKNKFLELDQNAKWRKTKAKPFKKYKKN